jgi:hypothetical protein
MQEYVAFLYIREIRSYWLCDILSMERPHRHRDKSRFVEEYNRRAS